ncbi:MAG: putative selenate ABC transporter substrate-binding protein [Planctomycetota bacterium]|jgi:phosphonate transport system substrate-binding protein
MRLIAAALVALFLVACNESESTDVPVLRFSAIPDQEPTQQTERFRPVAEYLSKALGVKVEYVPVSKYSASVQAFKTGDIHFAWFGGLSGVQARLAVPGARAIAQGAEDPNFFSYFIASKQSGLKPGTDFPKAAKGMKFTFGSEGSTSGRLMPEYFIREATGAAPNEFFTAVGFASNHPATLAAVNSGSFDVGALNYKTYDNASAEKKANAIVIWKTPLYADYNLTAHADLDTLWGNGFTDKLQKAWLAMPDDICRNSFQRSKMIPAENSDFAKIEDTAKKLELAR